MLAIEISRHGGAEVIAITSSAGKAQAAAGLGARHSAGRLSPRIAGRFPLSRAPEAHARLADRKVRGKILLQA